MMPNRLEMDGRTGVGGGRGIVGWSGCQFGQNGEPESCWGKCLSDWSSGGCCIW